MSLYLGDKPIANDGLQRLTGEIGDIGIAPLGIDESLNLRRYLNGQVISQTQFEAFTNKVKSAIALYPNLATTESNWQAEVTNSKLGQCGKFVIDDEAGTIRLPAVVNAQGLLGLTGIGSLVDESLPNISGAVNYHTDENVPAGAFESMTTTGTVYTFEGTASNDRLLKFDASLSSSAYQTNAPVQQEAIQYPYYIQVATGIQEELPAIREYEINTPFFFGWSMYSENAPYNASLLASQGQYNSASVYPDLWTQLTGVELNTSLNVGDTIEISGKTYVKRGLPVKLSTDTYDDYDFVVNQDDQTFRLPLLNGGEDLQSNSALNPIFSTTNFSGERFTAPYNGFLYVENGSTGGARIEKNAEQIFVGNYAGLTAGNTMFMRKGDIATIYPWGGTGTATLAQSFFYKAVGNGTLYYYVGDVVQDASLINAGAVLSDVVDLKQTTLRTDQITNCITEIPQDIKLELNNGTLTLKAGSKVYVPNGSGVFNELLIDSDKTLTDSDNTVQLICINSSNKNMIVRRLANCVSGAGATTTAGFAYNTTTNQVRFFDADGTDQGTNYSLPIAIITVSGGSITSIDQVFNGSGYIGSTVFALPGVKGLIPNGRNVDGSLRNSEFTTSKVLAQTTSDTNNFVIMLAAAGVFGSSILQYSEKDNLNINKVNGSIMNFVVAGTFTRTAGVVSNFHPKQPFRAVDRNDSSWLSGIGMPSDRYIDLTLGATGSTYTAPANGYFYFGKRATAANQYIDMYNYTSKYRLQTTVPSANIYCLQTIPARKGDVVKINYTAAGDSDGFRFIYAEGETDV